MIKNIIFDLGNVLIKVHFDNFINGLIEHGISKVSVNNFISRTNLKDELESGRIKFDEFYKIASGLFDKKISKNKFREIFNNIFTEMPGFIELLKELHDSKKYFIVLLSNTNNQHFKYFKNSFPHFKYFNKFALSYKLKLLKPDPAIYYKVMKMYNLKPDETIFIDDLEDNCIAAEGIGIKAINYRNFRLFKTKLNKLLKN